jgi:hypothetical protein
LNPIDKVLGLLTKVLRDPSSRKETVNEFERYYTDIGIVVRRSIRRDVKDILDDLAWDLAFYVADLAMRAEDPSYYGDERLVEEIESTLRSLAKVGVIVRKEGGTDAK